MSLRAALINSIRSINLTKTLKIVCAIALLIVILEGGLIEVVYEKFNIRYLWALLAVQPLIIIALVVQSKRHAILIAKPVVPLFHSFKAVVLSQGLNILIPGRVAELLKGTYLRNHSGVALSSALSAVIIERAIDLIVVSVFGLFCIYFLFVKISVVSIVTFFMAGFGFVLVVLLFRKKIIKMITKLPWPGLVNFLINTYQHLILTIKSNVFVWALIIGLFGWGLSFLNIYLYLKIAGTVEVSISGAMLVFVSTTFASGLPALPGSIGTYEAACFASLRALGFQADEAISLSVAIHITQLILPFLLAILIMMTEKIGLSSIIKELSQQDRLDDKANSQ